MDKKLFSKDFTLVVLGQIISLFGNAAVRFALPLYLLNLTGSSALYGTVTACAFIPAILLSPVGGIVADRINKRNIMVILDFFTSAVILLFCLLMDQAPLTLLLTVTLMLLYGIAGAYQPSVQASIPVLVNQEHFMAANSVINTISSFSALTGPVIGGILYVYIILLYSQAYYIMLDFPGYSTRQIMSTSRRIMKGNKGRLFYMVVTLIPYYLLAFLSCGIAMLWISPYMETSLTNFYLDLMHREYAV